MKNFLFFSLVFIGAITISLNGYAQTDDFPGTTLNFDGIDDYVDCGDNSNLDLTDSLTIEVWIKADSWKSNVWEGNIVSKEGNISGYMLRCGDGGKLSFNIGITGSWHEITTGSTDTLSLNVWYHIAAVYDGATQKIYINGDLVKKDSVTGSVATNTKHLLIGTSPSYYDRCFSGQIDEVRLWDVALDSFQIRENMNLPLSGNETGLISYWQCNDGSGTSLSDAVSENNGVLTNMTDDDWVNSTIPFGPGYSDTETEAADTVNFTNTGMLMNFSSQNGAEITVTRIDTLPNVEPTEPDEVFDNQYWIVNRYGSGSFNTDITFTVSEDLTTLDESNPSNIKLYTRSSTADTNWVFLKNATSVNSANNEATFSGITGFSQFIIATTSPAVITLYQNHFDLKTNNFNSIDVGYNSAPAFTDLDGDGLLDLMVGESYGNLNHYEQDSENSTSFHLVTDNFNSINIGSHSTPVFTDLDGDGLLDLMVGEGDGNLNHYEQDSVNSTSFTLVTDHFDSINVGYDSSPAFTDLDGDGLLDLMVGEGHGNLNRYEKYSVNSTSFHLVTNSFNSIEVGYNSAPVFTDLDGDGLLDLIVGEQDGYLSHYEQGAVNSTSFTLVAHHFNSIDVGDNSTPAFTDLDGDELLDLMVGEHDGHLNHYEQQEVSSFDFGNVPKGKTRTKAYSVKVLNLKTNLDIVCPPGYKISLSENSGYAQSLSIAPTNGRVSDSIYVRFEPVDTVTYSGNISHSTTDAETKNIAVNGTGVILPDNFPGNALDFDGTDDYVDCGDNSNLDLTDNLTIEVWIKADSWKSNVWEGNIVSKEGNISGYMLRCGDGGKLSFNIGIAGSWHEITTGLSDALSLNTWYHIATVYDGATQKIYINGDLVKKDSVTGSVATNTKHLLIGTSPSYYDRCYSGKIDEVRLWDVALDSVQIRENMNLPFSGNKTGLVSYWQCNDGSGTTLSDAVSENNGVLTNMTDDDWVNSTIPFGPGYSDTETEAAGTVNFTNTGMSMNFSSQNRAEITVTRIDTLPNVEPTEPDEVFNNQYWVVNRYGSGSFNTDLTFTISENLTASDESNPSNIKLYTRSSTADSNWVFLKNATSVNAVNNEATFSGITYFSQFIIARNPTVITLYQNHFDLKTNNFNSIEVGYNSAPAFTDLDGDGLLDLLVGEWDGNLIHYEQDTENSTSFTLVTGNFNSIDVGYRSTPAFTDLDGDGLLDLLVGKGDGNLNHYEQDAENSTSFHLVTVQFNNINVGLRSDPTFTDLDGDGLLDLIVGESTGNLNLYEQDSENSTSFHLVTNSFNSIDVGSYSAPAFTDLDGDGLLDLLIGEWTGKLYHYEQDAVNSTSFHLVTDQFNNINVGLRSDPTFTDLDGDGLLDLIVGERDGYLNHYEQQGVSSFDFGNVPKGKISTKVYSAKVLNLKTNLDIDCPPGYKVSLSEDSGYVQSLSIAPSNGRVSDSLYIRFEPVDTVTYSGNISHSTTDAETKNIAVSGTGVILPDNFPGNALDFDGTDDYVDCGDNSNLNLTDSLTIEVWIKADSWKSNVWDGNIVSKEGSNSGYMLRCGDGGKLNFNIGINGSWHEITTGSPDALSLNTWYHIATVYDGATQKIYINGELVKEDSVTGSIATNTKHLLIGTSPSYYDRCFSGQIDEVRLWDVALDSVQIRENMSLPLSGYESGLFSYWQCNDGSGITIWEIVGGNDGTLTNMTDDDWVNSTIPFGPGYSDTETEAAGTVNFTNTGLSMDFSSQNGAEITVTRIDTLPNVEPTEPDEVFNNQYWVVNRYGSGSFNTDLTFTISENLTVTEESNPSNIKLYTRSSTADSNWVYLMDATSVNASNDKATFTGITNFGQFIIAKTSRVITLYQNHFDLKTNNFNSIDVGSCSSPAFTDLNGDGLLDLLIGNNDGNLNHYKQDSVNSTSFTLVTNNFNSIDVGNYSAPAFTDLDGNGLLDLMVGEHDGNLNLYEQDSVNSTSFTLVTDNFNSIDVGDYSAPTFTDLDGDGLLDLMVGEHDGNLNLYEQDSVNSTSFTLVTSNFNSIDVGNYSAPAFTDLDGDGLLDLMVGEYNGNLNHYEQDAINSTSFTLVPHQFNSINVKYYSTPAFTDLDGDSLLDLMVGENDGNLNHYEQQGISSFNFGKILTGKTKVYSVKASNLTTNLDISCPSAYKVSLSKNSGYVQSLSIAPTNGQVSDSIYVRFEPVDTVTYSGNISHSSTDAETKNIAVSGEGVNSSDNFPGHALEFDGSDDYVDCGGNSNLNLTDSLTIEVWIKADSWKSNVWDGNIVSKEGSNSGYMLRCGDGGKLNFNIGINGSWHEITTDSTDTLSLNVWYHIAIVYDGATQKIYINGALVKEDSVTGYIATNTKHLLIGTSPGYVSTRCFSGKIDEVKLWDVALDSTQIRENMYQTLTGYESGLVSYWQCNDGSGTTLSDIVSGNAGTLTNMTDDDWVSSTAPIPYATVADGPWEQDTIWDVGQNVPVHPWSRVKIKHNITLNSNMELIEITVDTNTVMTISVGDTLTVTGNKP